MSRSKQFSRLFLSPHFLPFAFHSSLISSLVSSLCPFLPPHVFPPSFIHDSDSYLYISSFALCIVCLLFLLPVTQSSEFSSSLCLHSLLTCIALLLLLLQLFPQCLSSLSSSISLSSSLCPSRPSLSHQLPLPRSFSLCFPFPCDVSYPCSLSALLSSLIRLLAFSLRCLYDH